MAWIKSIAYFLRPSILLGLLLCALIVCGFGLYIWEKNEWTIPFLDLDPFEFDRTQGVVLTAAFLAAAGWMITSLVTLRNSVKQHTINTLLTSRLSATYMDNLKAVQASFMYRGGALMPLTAEEVKNPPPSVDLISLGYLLNYFEFIAVGIRHGDLHERVMKSSMRGNVCTIYCIAEELIKSRRNEVKRPNAARVYEHLCWLHERWKDDDQLPPRIKRPAVQSVSPQP